MEKTTTNPVGAQPGVKESGDPRVLLYIDDSQESERAFRILEDARIPFRVEPSHRTPLPAAEWGGLQFEGLSSVHTLVSTLMEMVSAFEAELRKTMPSFYTRSVDPATAREIDEQWGQEVAESRAILRRVQAQSRS
jgi:hypothetical protein